MGKFAIKYASVFFADFMLIIISLLAQIPNAGLINTNIVYIGTIFKLVGTIFFIVRIIKVGADIWDWGERKGLFKIIYNYMKVFIGFLLKHWNFWKLIAKAAGGCLIAWLLWKGFVVTWNSVAFANPKVKELVLDHARADSLLRDAEVQLQVLSDEIDGYYERVVSDSLNHQKVIQEHQILEKTLLNRAVFAEKLLSQFDKLGACRYPEDSIIGKWPNRQKVTVWRTKPCTD